jgi:hypothetical protein
VPGSGNALDRVDDDLVEWSAARHDRASEPLGLCDRVLCRARWLREVAEDESGETVDVHLDVGGEISVEMQGFHLGSECLLGACEHGVGARRQEGEQALAAWVVRMKDRLEQGVVGAMVEGVSHRGGDSGNEVGGVGA